jgi:hypothetical protein
MEPHLVDHCIPDQDWHGYLCPKDGQLHEDATIFLENTHCIVCRAQLKEIFRKENT